MTRVLITNDDGIAAPGLRALARAVAATGAEVTVAAPHAEASGTSAALTAVERDGQILVEPRALEGVPGVPGYAVTTSPAFIVVLALRGGFGDPPDVVVSGINRGANAGTAVLHSGTVGAALTAAANGLPALAVSLDVLSPSAGTASSGGAAIAALDHADDEARHWDVAADLAARLLPALPGLPAGALLNLNVPDVPADELRGLRRGPLASFGQVQVTVAEAGEGHLRTAVQAATDPLEEGSDLALLADGYAVVTPVRAPAEATDVALDLEAIGSAQLVQG
ncbi:5'/3'-nucleotidase SurE [Spirilliplanes yamanashiensis]|uniref:5'-nucleotidase SurE n=1 Tax=Spirilliplanes yamanashiensis TaxID=42233 RepID=A0A8J4DME4_9ACTN|nr:5'/3'-nucleotidase SurE [Spirilliplanes yamanashiensis]MDP9816608.1 5'-nucleotidase [Spirilliplanes yamanashiensis]GIJ06134.1 5'/3'-nucleotidase SurE [Spirilliplanes yamanashiensis]